eukprot:CAMPEP_0119285544 /NCGR_PEP_ID=MMETSP1329-20130426/32415_1 /TAXON_ID=114041 /ORGANISM="Genus nov. species nov., Strain RCC1024" /LENGTH=64 /DNA_ID=CAMNT_0007286255 /DNA_START=83 /DNA_END=273 /DNA_ORIENTATION=+
MASDTSNDPNPKPRTQPKRPRAKGPATDDVPSKRRRKSSPEAVFVESGDAVLRLAGATSELLAA